MRSEDLPFLLRFSSQVAEKKKKMPHPKISWSAQVWQVLVVDGILSRGPLNFSLSQLMKYLALQ